MRPMLAKREITAAAELSWQAVSPDSSAVSVRCCALTLPGAPFRQRERPVAPFDEGSGSIRIVAACAAGLAARGPATCPYLFR